MRILHVTLTLNGASGVATFVHELNERLCARGIESFVRTNDNKNKLQNKDWDIIHIHGLWLYRHVTKWAKNIEIPIIWSTHGMTSPWSLQHKWWKKLPAWILYQKRDLKNAAVIHCTTELEVNWNKQLGFEKCFIAPLGTNETSCKSQNEQTKTKKILLYVGRIHPVKGLINLIQAWGELFSNKSIIKNGTEKWKLRIVGPDEAGHEAILKALVTDLGLHESVEFPGPKFGNELSAEYESCDCLTLPSFSENFGATVVDALAHGKPCIASKFTPWKELQDRGCGWWVSNEPSELAKTIREMMSVGDLKRHKMGANGITLVEEKYTWDAVTKRMIDAYQSIIQNS